MSKKLPSQKRVVMIRGNRARVPVLSLVFFLSFQFAFSQLQLLKDIDTNPEGSYNEYSSLTHGQGRMYFLVNKQELWKSNGTPESSVKLKTFKSVSNLTMVGSTLYFTADDGASGAELWRSNGTTGTTVRVKDIVPGTSSSSPQNLTNVNGILFFSAYYSLGGTELWRSDGTGAGTYMVKDLAQGSSNPRNFVNANGTLYFGATNNVNGYELWKSDGTAANTVQVKDLNLGKQSSDPQQLTYFNGRVYFTAYDPTYGRELWSSDGTSAGTARIKDIRPGMQSSTPENLIVINTQMFFSAHDGVHGDELWKSDGTTNGTVMVKDLNPGGFGSNATNELKTPMRDFSNMNGILFFVAAKGATEYVYRSDGTAEGTFTVAKSNTPSYEVFQPELTYMSGFVYFFNDVQYSDDQTLLRMPYKGNASNVMSVRTIGKPYSWFEPVPVHNEMIHFYNNVYFFGRFSRTEYYTDYGGYEFLRSDGSYEGTTAVVDAFVTTSDAQPRSLFRAGGIVYMYIYGVLSYTPPLYRTDGTPEGTFQLLAETHPVETASAGNKFFFVHDVDGNYEQWELGVTNGTQVWMLKSSETDYAMTDIPYHLTGVGDNLYFTNELGQLWKSDGSVGGTTLIKSGVTVYSIKAVGSQGLIFMMSNGVLGLWKTTATGVSLVTNLPGTGSVSPTRVSRNILYFSHFNNGAQEIWRTDGTSAGTYVLNGSTSENRGEWDGSYLYQLMVANGEVYFSSHNTSGGTSLFHLNNATGIEKIADIPLVTTSVIVNDKMLMFAGAGESTEVYVSDGTSEGTELATTLNSPLYADWVNVDVIGNYAYFNGNHLRNSHVWRSDGTVCGTYQVDLGTTGDFGLIALGNDLVFGGHTIKTGIEPFVYKGINAAQGTPACVETLSPSSAVFDDISRNKSSDLAYPNPFTTSFNLKIDGSAEEVVEIGVYTIYGTPVETLKNVRSDKDYELGGTWPKGSYILKIASRTGIVSQQVIKK